MDYGEIRHENGLQAILKNLPCFNVRAPVIVAKESQLYDGYGNLIGEPDILVIDDRFRWHNFEYKCSDKHKLHAREQLTRASEIMKKYFDVDTINYHVWGEKLNYLRF